MNINKILIYATTRQKAVLFLEKLIKEIKREDIEQIKKSKEDMSVRLKNGIIYQTALASESSRGCKYHKAYVEKNIDKEIVEDIIKPSGLLKGENIIYFD